MKKQAAKKTTTTADKPRRGELREEFQLRQLVAKQRLKMTRSMLATHASAETGRKNRDWKASTASADQSIIPDATILNARSRQCIRDSWIGKAAVRAFSRNVVGCGILPIPMAKDAQGQLLPKVNKKLLKLFWTWANNREFCDIEKRQTFWQKQNLMVEERVAVGEAFLLWSYVPNANAVGLRLQSFEAEQLDLRLQSFTDENGNNNQVRGGIEVDANGAPVAYHFYTRNPTDYLIASFRSVRILAARVIHYFKQERVLQTRGVTPLAPVLQEIRDHNRFRDAKLWRKIMEACIGMVITKDALGGSSPFGLPAAPGADTQTQSGMRMIDFTPGMVPELNPGEEMSAFIPTSDPNDATYIEGGLQGIGAGIGLSGSQITRQSKSNYSAARQDMLEDRKEFEPEQEMMAHNVLLNPLWSIFVRFAVIEGRLDDVLNVSEFNGEPDRFCEAEYVAPAAPWIDPNNEASAYEKLLSLKVMDREEVAALRGKRLSDILDKIESEREEAAAKGITFPEDAPPPPPPGAKPEPSAPAKKATAARLAVMKPPNYRDGDAAMSCATCSYFYNGKCTKFNADVEAEKVCDAWDEKPIGKDDESGVKKTFPPFHQSGDPPIDAPGSPFVDNPAYSK